MTTASVRRGASTFTARLRPENTSALTGVGVDGGGAGEGIGSATCCSSEKSIAYVTKHNDPMDETAIGHEVRRFVQAMTPTGATV